MKIQFKALDPRIGSKDYPLPAPATAHAAGVDLRALLDQPVTLAPGETKLIGTGVAVYIGQPGFVGLLYPRSGLGHKHGVVLGNLTGVIDSDYQGELMVSLWNRSNTAYTVEPAERIAQLVITPCVTPEFVQVETFDQTTQRSEGGFGHTGKQ